MSETITLPLVKSAFIDPASPNSRISGQASQNIAYTRDTRLLLFFYQMRTGNYRFRPIVSVTVNFYGLSVTYSRPSFSAFGLSASDFSPNAVTYNTKPALSEEISAEISIIGNAYFGNLIGTGLSAAEKSRLGAEFLRAPTVWPTGYLWPNDASCVVDLTTNAPYLSVVIGDNDLHGTIVGTSFTSGYVNPHKENVFTCSVINGNELSCVGDLSPIAETPTLYWRAQGASTWNEIASTYSFEVPVPANTFPVGAVEWKVKCADATGTLLESAVYTVSTTDSLASAEQLAPSATVEDGGGPIVFSWNAVNSTGTAPTGAELQFSTDNGTTWSNLATITGSSTSYTAAANTFSAGDILWRVRVKNADGVAGDWSSSAFVCVGAPAAPVLNANRRPFATFSWQANGQEAYEISVDGKSYGVKFGGNKEMTLAEPLSDGVHTIRVRVQNSYGLWSEWGEAAVDIVNSPGRAVNLSGSFGVDASLSWETTAVYNNFMVYRDGVLIGFTHSMSFIDRFVLGEHEYYLINRFPNGYYTKSNTVKGKMCVRHPVAALFEGGDWISLRYSEKSPAEQRFNWSRTHSLRHIAGAAFPFLEISPYEDLSGTYDAAFLSAADAEAFRGLRGKVIVIKSPSSKVLVGALLGFSEVVNPFYLSFQFTIEQIAWEDYVDDTDS